MVDPKRNKRKYFKLKTNPDKKKKNIYVQVEIS